MEGEDVSKGTAHGMLKLSDDKRKLTIEINTDTPMDTPIAVLNVVGGFITHFAEINQVEIVTEDDEEEHATTVPSIH